MPAARGPGAMPPPPPPSLSKNHTKCTSRQNIKPCAGAPRSLCIVFLTGTAGVPSYCLVRAGPRPHFKNKCKVTAGVHTRHTDFQPAAILHWLLTRMVGGRHGFRHVLPRAFAHVAHSARAARLARVEHVAHLAHVEHVAHLAHKARLARLGPWGAKRTWCARSAWHACRTSPASRACRPLYFPAAVHPMATPGYAETRLLLMWWEGGWE